MTEAPAELELRNRAYALGPHEKKLGLAVAGLIGVAIVAAVIVLAKLFGDPAARDAATQFFGKGGPKAWQAFGFVAATVLLVLELGYLWLASRGERLFLDSSGMRLQSPLPGALQFLYPSWSLKWEEIRRARLEQSSWALGPASAVLVLSTYAGVRRIRPYAWVDATRAAEETPMQGLRRLQAMSEAELAKAVTESVLVKYVKARRPQLDLGDAGFSLKRSFALERNRQALMAVGAFFVLVAYSIADTMLNGETYAAAPPFAVFVGGGVVVTVLVAPWLRRSAVPIAESMAVGLLLGIAAGIALYPGLLRINQLTDAGGLQTYRFVLQRDFSLVPERKGLPVLVFPRFPEYWMQFRPGSTHEFQIRFGGLEFHQIDMAPVYAKTREFYRNRP